MNRNIVTLREASETRAAAAKSGSAKLGPGGVTMDHPGITTEIKPDRWHESFTKAIPAEALSLYIALSAIVVGDEASVLEGWWYLAGIVIASLTFNVLYLRRLWKVEKTSQLLLSCAALLFYVYANGGRLVESLPFHNAKVGSLLLIIVAAFLALYPVYGGASGKHGQISPGAASP